MAPAMCAEALLSEISFLLGPYEATPVHRRLRNHEPHAFTQFAHEKGAPFQRLGEAPQLRLTAANVVALVPSLSLSVCLSVSPLSSPSPAVSLSLSLDPDTGPLDRWLGEASGMQMHEQTAACAHH